MIANFIHSPREKLREDCRARAVSPSGWRRTPGEPRLPGFGGRNPGRLRALVLIGVWGLTTPGLTATLSDPEVDAYNVRVGTQTFAGLYQFTTNSLLLETAQAIRGMGSDILKMYLGSNWSRQYRQNLPAQVTNLVTLVRDEPACRETLDMPFRHVIAWAYPFGNPDAPFSNGYLPAEAAADYRELYDLTRYFLTNYNDSGRTLYLGHWEGDGYFMPWTTNPSPVAIRGMIDWLNNRQQAIDDAKAATPHKNVEVYGYAEANRVRDAMLNGPTNNQRVINLVVPYVTNLDCLSYSSYDAMNLGTAELYATLDYMHSRLPTNKLGRVRGERLWIGEYGWGGSQTSSQQEPTTRGYIQRLLNYPSHSPPYILFWEMYNNEPGKAYWLIDSNNVKVACYYLHQRFINNSRLAVAKFKEKNGRVPDGPEFVSLVTPMLDQPLPATVSLTVSNLSASLLSNTSARILGSLTQGIYGDDCASVWVFFGRQDGVTDPAAWERSAYAGINTNFNPSLVQAVVSNLVSGTNYFYRFYTTNATGAAWAPSSATFTTASLNASEFGSKLQIFFSGYEGSEAVLNCPLLVRLSTNLAGFSYRQFASPAGGDLRFADSGGLTPLPYEIDEWNTNGTSTVWVRVPRLGPGTNCAWAYWGNPLAVAPEASTTNGAAWSFDHHLVWHLKETALPYYDSARQHPATSGVAPSSSMGAIGRACSFNGTSQYLNAGAVNLGAAFTLSAWVFVHASATNIQTIWANKSGGWDQAGFALYVNNFQTADGTLVLETGNGVTGIAASTTSNLVTRGQWHHVLAVIDRVAGSARLYVDGADQTLRSTVRGDFENQAAIHLGRFTNNAFLFRGLIDEARIERVARTPDWVRASWMTGRSNTALANYSAVTQQRPLISLRRDPQMLWLSWPAAGVGFDVCLATNLMAPVFWTFLPATPFFSNGMWRVALPAVTAEARFYRLQAGG
jgi:hypothetical protein